MPAGLRLERCLACPVLVLRRACDLGLLPESLCIIC